MWSGGISNRNPVRPAGKWARGLTCQTAKTPACQIQIVTARRLFFPLILYSFSANSCAGLASSLAGFGFALDYATCQYT